MWKITPVKSLLQEYYIFHGFYYTVYIWPIYYAIFWTELAIEILKQIYTYVTFMRILTF